MIRKGTVIRNIDFLDISNKAKIVAKEMANQCELPLVFLIDHDLDKHYAVRSQFNHNQFWVLANHQNEQSEYERIILSNIYRAIEDKNRNLYAIPTEEYEKELSRIKSIEVKENRLQLYYEFIKNINAFVTTIDAELHLKPKGFEVSAKQKQLLFENRINILDEYIEMQKRNPSFFWYKEIEYINIIDYSRISTFDKLYRDELVKKLKKIKPLSVSKRLIHELDLLSNIIDETKNSYKSNPEQDISTFMIPKIIKSLGLENMVQTKRSYALQGNFNLENGNSAAVYSFIPKEFLNKEKIISAIRYANECISLFRECHYCYTNEPIIDVHVNIIKSDHINAYANIVGNEPYISFTTSLLNQLMEFPTKIKHKLPNQLKTLLALDEINHRLSKYAIYYITMHEYAHILNGDCSENFKYSSKWNFVDKKEKKADEFSKSTIIKILPLQYRYNRKSSIIENINEMNKNKTVDPILFKLAKEWCDEYFDRTL